MKIRWLLVNRLLFGSESSGSYSKSTVTTSPGSKPSAIVSTMTRTRAGHSHTFRTRCACRAAEIEFHVTPVAFDWKDCGS